MEYTDAQKAEILAEYDRRRANKERTKDIEADFKTRGIARTFQNWRTQSKKPKAQKTPMHTQLTPFRLIRSLSYLNRSTSKTRTHQAHPVSADEMLPIGSSLPVISEALSPAEVQSLEHYEQMIAEGIEDVCEVGQALLSIRDQRLYRQSYSTFEDYLRQRWDLGSPYAYRLMDASAVVEHLLPIGSTLPVNEAQARPLTSLPPEQQREVWQVAVDTAPAGKVTAKHVQETVKRVKATGTTSSNTTTPKAPKLFDVQTITTKIKELYMDWLRHCDDDDTLETAQFFLNTLSDLAQGRAMLLHPRR